MQDRISLLGSGMAGVINATSKHFQLLLKDRPVDGKKITIEVRHFDAAIAVRWNFKTSLLAQVAIEHGLKLSDGSPNSSIIAAHSKEARDLQSAFDTEYAVWNLKDSPRMRWIREALPITVIIPE